MAYIEFDKEQLVNINFSKKREILRCSRTGSFATTTILGLNTRKYHGLFIVPQDNIDGERHLLVSNLNETFIINDMEFHIGVQQFKGGILHPKGHKYLENFNADLLPTYQYKVGNFTFNKELLFVSDQDRVLIKYTVPEQFESAFLQIEPFLAFRQIHQLTFKNYQANTNFEWVKNGVRYCLYDQYTPVYIQSSEPVTYRHEPTWYNNVEYEEEIKRGYDGHEDLMRPGKLQMELKQKELYISIGTTAMDPTQIQTLFQEEMKKKTTRSSFINCLINAADQFIIKRGGKTYIVAGYPWFGRWGRDTFIALPGLTLALNKPQLFKEIIDSIVDEMQDGLFPNIGGTGNAAYNSVDAPLWFIRALQQYAQYTKMKKEVWKEYGMIIKSILNAYRQGTLYNIRMEENGLIYAGSDGVALTWMDAVVDSVPVTPRTGYQVEINGLWYNAIQFALELAKLAKESEFVHEWESIAKGFPNVFKETFWSKEKGYLADYVNGDYKNFQIRPNMVIVTSLPYSPISEKIKQLVLNVAMKELLTDKGLRTLSPQDVDYKGFYEGNQAERDRAYHQGTNWPWLLAPYAEGLVAVHQKDAIPVLEKLLYQFDAFMKDYGVSTIAEITDGNPPFKPKGCISQAWSVAAALQIKWLIEKEKGTLKEVKKV